MYIIHCTYNLLLNIHPMLYLQSSLLTLAGPKHFTRNSKIMARQTRNVSLWAFVYEKNSIRLYNLCKHFFRRKMLTCCSLTVREDQYGFRKMLTCCSLTVREDQYGFRKMLTCCSLTVREDQYGFRKMLTCCSLTVREDQYGFRKMLTCCSLTVREDQYGFRKIGYDFRLETDQF